ncbi:MAG: DUF2239 family protein [Pseudomonadota bacterium]
MQPPTTFIAFLGNRCLAEGTAADVARLAAAALQADPQEPLLVFDADSARQVELDLRGSPEEAAARAVESAPSLPSAPRGRGRPQLGVVAREVTLLPRHWEWLASQPGGASVTLRRLVEAARRSSPAADAVRLAQERGYRFLTAMAGNLPDYEEALRALFGRDGARFDALTQGWPHDVARIARRLAADAFAEIPQTQPQAQENPNP